MVSWRWYSSVRSELLRSGSKASGEVPPFVRVPFLSLSRIILVTNTDEEIASFAGRSPGMHVGWLRASIDLTLACAPRVQKPACTCALTFPSPSETPALNFQTLHHGAITASFHRADPNVGAFYVRSALFLDPSTETQKQNLRASVPNR